MPRFMKSERLKQSKEFKAVFEQCRKLDDGLLAFYVQFSGDAGLRKFGVSLSRALGKAYLRNRLKRRLREIYRVEKEKFRGGYQVIVVPRRGSAGRDFDEIRKSFLTLATRAGLLPRMK
ncbi:MAG TPA: ribonuclease P protein component [bacterium]|nr:ribonuclease P protein component [bacterium]